MAAPSSNFSALGRALVAQGKLAQSDANAIQMEAVRTGVSFVGFSGTAKHVSCGPDSNPSGHHESDDESVAAGLLGEQETASASAVEKQSASAILSFVLIP